MDQSQIQPTRDPQDAGYTVLEDEAEQHTGKKSLLHKVKEKARKIKKTVLSKRSHGQDDHAVDGQHDSDLSPKDDASEKFYEDEMDDPNVLGSPIYDSAAVTGATAGKGGSTGDHGIIHANKVDSIDNTPKLPISTPPGSRGADEGIQGLVRKPITLEEDPNIHGSTPANYQSKVTDPTGAGCEEIKLSPMVESFGKLSVKDEKDSKSYETPRGTPDDLSSELSHTEAPQSPSTATVYDSAADTGATAGKGGSTGDHGINHGNKGDIIDNTPQLPISTPPTSRDADEGIQGLVHKPITLEEDPNTHGSPANYQSKVTDPTGAGCEEMKLSPMVESFGKLSVEDGKDSKSYQSPRGTPDDLSSELSPTEAPQSPSPATGGSYTDKPSHDTSVITGGAISAKDAVASKLGYGGGATTPAAETELGDDNYESAAEKRGEPNKGYVAGVTERLAPVYDKVPSVGNTIMSKVPGTGARSASTETETNTPMEYDNPLEADSGANKGYVASLTERVAPVYNKVAGTGVGSPTTETEKDARSASTETETNTPMESDTPLEADSGANKGYVASLTERLAPAYNKVAGTGSGSPNTETETDAHSASTKTETNTPMESDTSLKADSGANKGYVASLTERLAPVYNKDASTGAGSPTTKTETNTPMESDTQQEADSGANKGYVASLTERLAPVYKKVASTGAGSPTTKTETNSPMESDTPHEADSGANKGYVASLTERLAPVYNKVAGTGAGSPATKTETDTGDERDIGIGTESETANKGYASGVTEKLTPDNNKASSAGTATMSKFTGSGADAGTGAETEGAPDKSVSVADYLSEGTKPNEENKALSDTIAEALYLKSKDSGEGKPAVKESDEVARQLGTGDEHNSGNAPGEMKMNSPGGVVNMVKSWFGTGNEDAAASSPKGKTAHEEIGERRLHESSN